MTRFSINHFLGGSHTRFIHIETPRFKLALMGLLVFSAITLTASCNKDMSQGSDMGTMNNHRTVIDGFLNANEELLPKTVEELKLARAASAKYQNINNARADGYSDINVVIPNMGYHFMKTEYVDNQFEIERPEILVYNKKDNGQIELVAVEYAVPIPLSPNQAPAGFTGDADVWTYSTVFNLWLLHAWVWENNPDGVFNSTNPLVHLH